MRDERFDEAPAFLVQLVLEQQPEPVGTAERLRFFDQQERDFGPQARHGDGSEAPGQASTGDQQPVPFPLAHAIRLQQPPAASH
jgi:hypothetical protein